MDNKLKNLFMAHHPETDFLEKNCHHYYCDVLSIASIIPSPEYGINPYSHRHDEYEFLIPYGPIPMLINEGAVYFGEAGYIYPIQSGRQHAFKFRVTNIPFDHITINMEFLESIKMRKGYAERQFNDRFECTGELKSYIQFFKSEFDRQDEKDTEKLKCLAHLICSTFIDLEFQNPANGKQNSPLQYQKGILQVASYMNQHYTENLPIETLSGMCGISKNYFISSFKKVIGETPHNYLIKLRISKARILLETTDESIQEIAAHCGFQKANTFSSLFKSITGITPSEYRKSGKANSQKIIAVP